MAAISPDERFDSFSLPGGCFPNIYPMPEIATCLSVPGEGGAIAQSLETGSNSTLRGVTVDSGKYLSL